MKQKLYSLFLVALFGITGMNALAQNTYEIGTAQDLVAFAEAVNRGETGANAVLTADITLTEVWEAPIGAPSEHYAGTFDGQGHKITGFEATSENNGGGFFGYTTGATIKDFSIDGKLTSTGGQGSGVVGWATNCTISGIHSTLTISVPYSGVHHVGGVVGSAQGGNTITGCTFAGTMSVAIGSTDNFAGIVAYLRSDDTVLFCANYGTITFSDISCTAGGVVGYINNATLSVKGCLNTGTLIFDTEDEGAAPKWGGAIVGRLRTHDAAKLTGNYWLEGSATGGTKDNALASAVCFTPDQLPTGEVCYGLNGDQSVIGWYQTIGTDDAPVLDATHAQVYLNAHLHCNGDAYEGYSYSNTNSENIQDGHDFVDGFCSYCHLFDENFLTPNADGFYEIGNADQFVWFASKVNAGAYNANAILTADIDMTDADISVFPIGTGGENDGKRYIGTFDGQGHKFSNFQLINPSAANNFGIFNTYTGVALKNFWLDNTCAIEGKELVGLVGRHDGGGIFEGVGNCADVTGMNNNIGGFFGGVFGAPSNKQQVIIKNCWTTGTILTTNTSASNYKDCGALSGWFNNALITIEGFWTIAEVVNPKAETQYVYRNGNGASFTIKNCFSMYGAQPNFPNFTNEQLANGEIAWNLNGQSFVDAVWRQTIDVDDYPMPYGNGAIVYQTTSGYACVSPDDPNSFETFRDGIIELEEEFIKDEDLVAYQALIDEYEAAIESWEDIETIDEFLEAYKASAELKESIKQSAACYENYVKACESALAELEEQQLEGTWADFLNTYLNEAVGVEPGADYPNGSFAYIMENRNLDNEAIAAEIDFVNRMLENAIAGGITAGTDITRLLANSSFADGFEGWNLESDPGITMAYGGTTEIMHIARGGGNGAFNVSQTLTELPEGIYMMALNGMFRASDDVASQFYAGQLYLNGTGNYLMVPGEDVIREEEAEPGVNCLGEGSDKLYDMNGVVGWVPNDMKGSSYAFNAGRYLNYCATKVTDGTLTVGVRSFGTGLANDWMPFGNLHVVYLGNTEEANDKLTTVLSAFADRAKTIITSYIVETDATDFALYPSMSQELITQLEEAISDADYVATGEAKMSLINRFSSLFAEVYACRRAYIAMNEAATNLTNYLNVMDEASIISLEDLNKWTEEISDVQEAYTNGTFSTEEALAAAEKLNSVNLVPLSISEDGVYQLATADDVKLFSSIVNLINNKANAALTADIDMTEVAEEFEAIGTSESPFQGEFDGQNHKIFNFGQYDEENNEFTLGLSGDNLGFFGKVKDAIIKNFSIDGAFAYYGGQFVGAIGFAEGSTISNVHSSLIISIEEKSVHIGGVCGDLRAGSTASRCSFSGLIKEKAGSHDCIGGIGGYSNENCLYENCANYGTIEFAGQSAYAGGICGYVNNDNFIGVINCLNVGSVKMGNGLAPDYGGAIVGRLRNHANSKLENNFMLAGSAARAYGENTAAAEIVSEEKLASGEICFKLNGDQEEINWYQTLATDPYPVLDPTHLQVWLDGETYTNVEPSGLKGDVNLDGQVDIADAVTVLNAMAGQEVAGNADVNADGQVDIADFVTVLNIMAGVQ